MTWAGILTMTWAGIHGQEFVPLPLTFQDRLNTYAERDIVEFEKRHFLR